MKKKLCEGHFVVLLTRERQQGVLLMGSFHISVCESWAKPTRGANQTWGPGRWGCPLEESCTAVQSCCSNLPSQGSNGSCMEKVREEDGVMSDTHRVHQSYQKSLWDHTALLWGRDTPGKSNSMSPPVASPLLPGLPCYTSPHSSLCLENLV